MASYTPSYPLTLPTITGIKTQNFGLNRVVAVTESPFTIKNKSMNIMVLNGELLLLYHP